MASVYCATFRIANKTIGGKSYQDRYEDLNARLRAAKAGFWNEPTSFVLTESDLDTHDFCKNVSKALSKSEDMLFIFDPTDMSAAYFGDVESEEVLQSFFPHAKKVG